MLLTVRSNQLVNDDKADRRQQLMDAAEAILAEDGYEALSARRVAERAGLKKALVFYYWGSTVELFEKVLGRYYERHERLLADAMNVEGTLSERVHHVINAYLTFIEANQAYARIVQQQVSTGGPHLSLVQQHLGDVMATTARMLGDMMPDTGPLSARHFHLSLSAVVINYFTYGPVLGESYWGRDPMAAEALEERRAHVRWIVDAWLERLAAQ